MKAWQGGGGQLAVEIRANCEFSENYATDQMCSTVPPTSQWGAVLANKYSGIIATFHTWIRL